MISCFPNQEFFTADANLIDLATKVSKSNNWDYHIGTIISGEDFLSDADLVNEAASEDYKKFEELAAHKSAKLVKEMIYRLK